MQKTFIVYTVLRAKYATFAFNLILKQLDQNFFLTLNFFLISL